MRLIVIAFAVVAAAACIAPPAHAVDAAMTAADLKDLCSGSDHVSRNVCRIYILGVAEGISQGLGIAAGKGARACIPDGVSAERLEQTVKAQLEQDLTRSPTRGTIDAASFLSAALAEAFPCRASKAAHP